MEGAGAIRSNEGAYAVDSTPTLHIDSIINELVGQVEDEHDQSWEPNFTIWQTLLKLEEATKDLTLEERRAYETQLLEKLSKIEDTTDNLPTKKSLALLKNVLSNVLGQSQLPAGKYLAEKVFNEFNLPNFKILLPGEEEPSKPAFNSGLVAVAAVGYSYNRWGRELVCQGGWELLKAAHHVARRCAVQALLFYYPNSPRAGENEPDMVDFDKAAERLNLFEKRAT